MLFERRLKDGIHDGSITVAFRRWRSPQVRAGGRYRTGLDMIVMRSVEHVTAEAIHEDDASRAGYASVAALVADLRGDESVPLYRLEFERSDEPDARATLAASCDIGESELATLTDRLARIDGRADRPWTLTTLRAIESAPGRRAAELATAAGLERDDFKRRVRTLKELGLTVSLETGYELSPRGRAYLARSGSVS